MNHYTDKQLAEAYQEGSTQALEELLHRYMPLILSYAKRQHTLTLGREEVIHQLILLFIEAIKAYDAQGPIPLAGYLQSKIHYGHWNLFKKVRRLWQHEILPLFQTREDYDVEDSHEDAVLSSLCYKDLHKRLVEALQALSNRDKDLIYAIYFQGKSLAQYARDSQCSRQNITYRHSKILKSLKDSLCDDSSTRY